MTQVPATELGTPAERADFDPRFGRLRTYLPEYAYRCLKIRTKSGAIKPFLLNAVQLHLHAALEKQLAETGRVRAIILKGRQEGCSTYVQGRFYHRTTWSRGMRAFILTHLADATANLFEMTTRFHEHCPEAVKPSTGAASARELKFDKLDSGYRVATAGGEGAGRSQTIQLFHGSEVAFWDNASEHAAGALQAVPDMPGTEVILESTANGLGNYFHQMWQEAEAGKSPYVAIFIPWFWADEYRQSVPANFSLTADEAEYQEAHGLTLEQMAWRRSKIAELGGDEGRFRQEYPATAVEAFHASGSDSFIKGELITRARATRYEDPDEELKPPLIVGVDPARFGPDHTAIIRRRGRRAFGIERHHGKNTMEVVGLIADIIDNEDPDRVFLDVGGLGAGVYDRLLELGYGSRVDAVNSAEKALKAERFLNRRPRCGANCGTG